MSRQLPTKNHEAERRQLDLNAAHKREKATLLRAQRQAPRWQNAMTTDEFWGMIALIDRSIIRFEIVQPLQGPTEPIALSDLTFTLAEESIDRIKSTKKLSVLFLPCRWAV